MNAGERRSASDLGGLTRRDLVSAMARWTVPTVLTLSLAVRAVYAAASCPPCTRKTGGACRACTVNQQLNCLCEPCLGPPYCASGAAAAAASVARPNAESRTQDITGALRRRNAVTEDANPFASPFGRSPYGVRADSIFGGTSRTPFGRSGIQDQRRASQRAEAMKSLYDRLREFDDRRRP